MELYIRISKALTLLFNTREEGIEWINTPNKDLDNKRPIDLILCGKTRIVVDLLEDVLLGHPS